MKTTYTSDDGVTWDSETECQGYERVLGLLEKLEACGWHGCSDEEDIEELEKQGFKELPEVLFDGPTGSRKAAIWRHRKELYSLVELMKEADEG